MASYKRTRVGSRSSSETALRLYAMQSPEVNDSLEKLRKRYVKHAIPVDELRKMLNRQLGDRSLTEELRRLRNDE